MFIDKITSKAIKILKIVRRAIRQILVVMGA